jgi:hypothetical protein
MIDLSMPDHVYHERPELSSTGARRILEEFGGSPATFKWERDNPANETPAAFAIGKAVHAEVLGVGARAIAYPENLLASNGAASTKAAKEWADEIRAQGDEPVKAEALAPIKAMADAVRAHPTAAALLTASHLREVSVFADVDGLPTRCRFDALSDETPQGIFALDLKTTAGQADKASFRSEAMKYGYFVQQEFYRDTYRASEGEEINFVFIVVEKKPPHLVAVHQLDVEFQRMGKTLAREARRIYKECTASGVWPGYPEDVQLVGPPQWAAMQHEEKYG